MAAGDYKVRLVGPNGSAVFEASAPIAETRQAEYDGYNVIHLPTSLPSYRRTSSRKFTINAKLVSRTPQEADANARILDLVRTWVLPDFGATGATPPVLRLYGYRNKNIDARKVIMLSYSWGFNDEVDYIYTNSQPMPVIGNIEISLEEVYTAEEVTAGAWRLSVGEAGEFEQGGGTGSSSSFLVAGIGFGRTDPLQTQIPAAASNGIASVLNGKVTIPGVIAGTIARTLGTAALNSPFVKNITSRLPPVLGNILVGGGNIAVNEIGKTVTGTVSATTQPTQPNGFNRDIPPPPTGPVGG